MPDKRDSTNEESTRKALTSDSPFWTQSSTPASPPLSLASLAFPESLPAMAAFQKSIFPGDRGGPICYIVARGMEFPV
jgi:hypothetical protein